MADNDKKREGRSNEAKPRDDKPAAAAPAEKPAAAAPAAAPAPVRPEPSWDRATWMSMANIRLGVPAHVIAGALHAEPAHARLTEADVRRLVKRVTEQSL